MSAAENRAVVERLWQLFAASAWDEAGTLLADDFVAEWPDTGEVFRGRENFLNVQRYYPPVGWRIEPRRFIAEGDWVAADIAVPSNAGQFYVASFAEVRDGRIRRVREYWIEAGGSPRPEGRAQWAEPPGAAP